MARLFDRVKETSTPAGAVAVTLAGAVTQYRAFSSVFTVGDTQIPYAIADQSGTRWEVGLGTYSAANTLTRDKIYSNSAGTLVAIDFNSGTQDIWVNAMADVLDVTGKKVATARGMAMP